jgi:DNA-binding transcriptional LysR family regulator
MNGLTIGRLRYLFETTRLGGVRAAADFLDVAPSAVSRQLALLEQSARTPLLETNRRDPRPTEAGRLLIDYYREYLSREEALISKLDAMLGMQYGNVAIGAVQGFTDDLMHHALREFNQRHPNVTILLKLGGVNDILNWLEDDDVHLGLTYGPGLDLHAARLREIRATVQPVRAIVKHDHPLAQRDNVTIRDLLDYPFAFARSGYGTRKIAEQIEVRDSVHFNVVLETDHLIGLASFVRSGMGLTMLPAFAVHDDIQRGALRAIEIHHPVVNNVQAQLIIRRGRELPVAALKLQRSLQENLLAFKTP